MHRLLRRLTLIVASLALLAIATAGCGAQSSAGGGGASPASGALLAQINAQRAAAQVPGLSWCASLERSAQGHADDQAIHNTMTHVGSDGSTVGMRDERAGYNGWTAIGENVAYGAATADQVMALWMNSPDHRANILNSAYTHFGGGISWAANGTPYWTQDFGTSGSC